MSYIQVFEAMDYGGWINFYPFCHQRFDDRNAKSIRNEVVFGISTIPFYYVFILNAASKLCHYFVKSLCHRVLTS